MNKNIDLEKANKSCSEYYDNANLDYLNQFSDELVKKPYDKDFLDLFISLLKPNGNILDIGCCSSAQQARYFNMQGFQVTAIDLSKKCIETARKNFQNIDFRQMDMTKMGYENEYFDGINAFYSIIHIPDEKLSNLFSDFNRILKTKGKLSIAVHAGDFYGFFDENEIPVFYRTFSQEVLKQYLTNNGFKIIEINQRKPIYDFEFQSERIYLIAEKVKHLG